MARVLDADGAPGVLDDAGAEPEGEPHLRARARVPGRGPARPGGLRGGGARGRSRCSRTTPLPCPRSPPWPRRVTSRATPRGYEERARARARARPAQRRALQPAGRAQRAQPSLPAGGGLRAAGGGARPDARGAGSASSASTSSALGAIDGRAQSLEASFEGDPYNVWIKNTLDLLDTFPKYKETRDRAVRRSSCTARRRRCSRPYAAALAEEAYAQLSARYGYRPDGPVRVEVYPDHADFSVRTVGLAGLAGLGVCFGPVLAIDSPSAREVGQFNWGSTLWHEMAHTFTLGMTRQPRAALVHRRPVRPRGAPRAAGLGRRRDASSSSRA